MDWYTEQIELGYRVQVAFGQENWPGYGVVSDPRPFRAAIIVARAVGTTG